MTHRAISNTRNEGPFSFFQCGNPQLFVCADSQIDEECDYDINPPELYSAVHTRQWGLALDRIKTSPEEAKIWVYRMGVEEAEVSIEDRMMSPRNNMRGRDKEVRKVMKWRMLPIHAAIIFNAPLGVIKGLLKAYAAGTTQSDDQGMLPLHLAFRSQSEEEVVLALLDVYPDAMERGDSKGRVPSQLAQKNSNLTYHDVIADAFLKSPSCYYHAARVATADRARVEAELTAEIQAVQENARKDLDEAQELFESTTNALNDDLEQLAFENSELKEKIEWYEAKYDGAEEKEQVLVDHTNSLAERLRLTSLSEEHLATKLAKLEGKLMMKNQELEEYKAASESQMQLLEEKIQELENALDKTHNKAKSLTEKLQQKVKESNESEIKFEHERKLYEKQIEGSRECLMELIASSKDDKKMFESDSKELRAQLLMIQSELSKNNQLPRNLEERLDSLQNEILSSRISQMRDKAKAGVQLKSIERNTASTINEHDTQSVIQTNVQRESAHPTSSSDATIQTQAAKQNALLPASAAKNDNGCETYVSQTRDDTEECHDDSDSLVALTELTDEQREALENLDLSGTKEEIAATLSKVPGLTMNQVNLLVDVAASLAV